MNPHTISIAACFLAASAVVAQDVKQPAPAFAFVDAFPAQKKFKRAIHIDHHPIDPDHYWVVQQHGTIVRVPRDGTKDERSELVDLSDRVLHPSNGGHNEEGLLGFAFDPDHAKNRFVYVYYSKRVGEEDFVDRRGNKRKRPVRASVVSRMLARDGFAGPLIDPDTELVLMTVPQPWGNHNGGTIVFGPDRMLYIAFGDGGAANDMGKNGQNKGSILATVARIDVRRATAERRYTVPDDNPFVGEEGTVPEIWAYGLRNPWRISFDRETGDLWCGDVGQNLYEEVDRIVRGANYGWPIREGLHEFPPGRDDADDPEGLIGPVAEYPREHGISITGGYVYRGTALPALTGRYVYGDYVFRTVWAVREDRSDKAEHDVVVVGKAPGPLASFAEEPDGELLALCYDGHVYRLVPGDKSSR